MTIHNPSYQKAGGIGRFIACTGCVWRSGFGTEQENRDQFASHVALVRAAEVPCPQQSPFPSLTEAQCTTGHKGHRGACTFPGLEGRSPLKVNQG